MTKGQRERLRHAALLRYGRMITELSLLDANLVKLTKFVQVPEFDALDEGEKAMMRQQLKAMNQYGDVLKRRIDSVEQQLDKHG
jgi:hypothetical protein